ncbi:MAG: tetratricopeptide repeat protein, partial [Candidatus Aenigmarchaeota archaeon]|nr:tetratricopeptide repeat protein [Candidatus Aenigmarchaeota archaeon]
MDSNNDREKRLKEQVYVDFLMNLAERALDNGNTKYAETTCEECLKYNISSYIHLVKLGKLCHRLNDLKNAISCYEKAAELNENEEILKLLAIAYEKLYNQIQN